MGCVSHDTEPPKKSVLRKSENWDQIAPSKSPRARDTTKKSREKVVHRKELCKSVSLKSAIRVRQNYRKEHRKKPCKKNDALAEKPWISHKMSTSSIKKHKATFHSPAAVWVMPAPSSRKPAVREFVVDSGASRHMLSSKDFRSVGL